jgi:hypothetical protein
MDKTFFAPFPQLDRTHNKKARSVSTSRFDLQSSVSKYRYSFSRNELISYERI